MEWDKHLKSDVDIDWKSSVNTGGAPLTRERLAQAIESIQEMEMFPCGSERNPHITMPGRTFCLACGWHPPTT